MSRGFTLLEMLVAIGLFAFMFVFVSQFLRQSHRQTRKITKDVQFASSLSHALDLIRRDLRGTAYFLDINDNFKAYFSEGRNPPESPRESRFPLFNFSVEPQVKGPTFMARFSPYFLFEGKGDEIRFVSHSFSRLSSDSSSAHWMKVHYFLEECDQNIEGSCLVRRTNQAWEPETEEDSGSRLVLFRGLSSLTFSYAPVYNSSASWDEEWKPQLAVFENFPFSRPVESLFPSVVKMEMESKNRKRTVFFPVSKIHLKTWNPYDKAYEGFPLLEPPVKPPPKDKKIPQDEFHKFRQNISFENRFPQGENDSQED